jgi:hypothetical protein
MAIERQTLEELVDLARLSASAANLQPLKYILSHEPQENAKIFPHLKWAAYLKEWPGPSAGERPTAYIIILGDTQISKGFGCDHGIAAQSILLGARERGLAGCMIGLIKREELGNTDHPVRWRDSRDCPAGRQVVIDEPAQRRDTKHWGSMVHHAWRSLRNHPTDIVETRGPH